MSDDTRHLADDERMLAKAEVTYQSTRAAFAGEQEKWIAILGLFGAVLCFFALMALTVGLVIALTPILTAWGATASVFGGLLLAAGLCALLAGSRLKHMKSVLRDEVE